MHFPELKKGSGRSVLAGRGDFQFLIRQECAPSRQHCLYLHDLRSGQTADIGNRPMLDLPLFLVAFPDQNSPIEFPALLILYFLNIYCGCLLTSYS
ncbi:MAG: hypothetical protein A2020_15680 [Lentisphaerae bacterium GWF2_45_14]|nr:MAG: hypothetical protein A2020_15680 [Lentisphaerae bacterium GWF2_45_14]